MHAIDQLSWALDLARELGYEVRFEWLGGARGGCCIVAGRKLLFVDVALGAIEQLEQIVEALQADPFVHSLVLTTAQRSILGIARAA